VGNPKQGWIQDFQLGGAHLKKLRRAEGGAKNFGVFRVKNHDFTPKNLIFSNFRGGRAPGAPTPPGSAPAKVVNHIETYLVHVSIFL
jgi:hypothetical protein